MVGNATVERYHFKEDLTPEDLKKSNVPDKRLASIELHLGKGIIGFDQYGGRWSSNSISDQNPAVQEWNGIELTQIKVAEFAERYGATIAHAVYDMTPNEFRKSNIAEKVLKHKQ